MKLHYFKDNDGNFGDALNPWFWSQVAAPVLDNDDSELLLGIGTIINHRLPLNRAITVFGSGAGYGKLPKGIDDWQVYCVRGPLTARKLGLDATYAVTDPAALCSRLYQPQITIRSQKTVSFIPHYTSARQGDWERVCADAGINYISPTDPPLEVICKIVASERIITEAMHGAILADSYGVPWIAVASIQLDDDDPLGKFHPKWLDWMMSLGVDRWPSLTLNQVWREDLAFSYTERTKNYAKHAIKSCFPKIKIWMPPGVYKYDVSVFDEQVQRLRDGALRDDFFLSDRNVLINRLDRLEELLCSLVQDHTPKDEKGLRASRC